MKTNRAPYRNRFTDVLILDGLKQPVSGYLHNNGFKALYTLTGVPLKKERIVALPNGVLRATEGTPTEIMVNFGGEQYYIAKGVEDIRKKIFEENFPADHIITTYVTSFRSLFHGKKDFNESISTRDTSNVTDFSFMFRAAEKFNQPVNHFDVSKCTNFDSMFRGALRFNQPIDSWTIKGYKGTYGEYKYIMIGSMFRETEDFNQNVDSILWNHDYTLDMKNTFRGAKGFNQNLNHMVNFSKNKSYRSDNAFLGAIKFINSKSYCQGSFVSDEQKQQGWAGLPPCS